MGSPERVRPRPRRLYPSPSRSYCMCPAACKRQHFGFLSLHEHTVRVLATCCTTALCSTQNCIRFNAFVQQHRNSSTLEQTNKQQQQQHCRQRRRSRVRLSVCPLVHLLLLLASGEFAAARQCSLSLLSARKHQSEATPLRPAKEHQVSSGPSRRLNG